MASRIIWSTLAVDDLRQIVLFIKRDNPAAAERVGYKIIGRIEMLREFPEAGRIVPEKGDERVRELILPPYRIIYRLGTAPGSAEIVRIWHGARGTPDLD